MAIKLLLLLLNVFIITDLIIEYRNLKEIKPMTKVLHSQAFNKLDIAIIYKTLEEQIKLNNLLMKDKLTPKVKVEAIKLVNKETKNTLKKVKVLAKEAGVEI